MPLNNALICTKQPYLSALLCMVLQSATTMHIRVKDGATSTVLHPIIACATLHLPILLDSAKHAKITIGVISITFGDFIAKKSLMKNSQPH